LLQPEEALHREEDRDHSPVVKDRQDADNIQDVFMEKYF
jgi:hypothetical protein